MVDVILGNKMSVKTFDYLKINEVKIKIPLITAAPYPIESDDKNLINIEEFDNIKYGVSSEALEINKKFGNLFKLYKTKPNEKKDFGIINLITDEENAQLLDTNNIIADENSHLKILFNYNSKDANEKFRNSIFKVLAKKNSIIDLFIINLENEFNISLESIGIYTEEFATVNVYQYELGSKNNYINYDGYMIGEKSNLNVNSIYLVYNNNLLNMLYNINHIGKETKSNILVNGALKDSSIKSFKSILDFKKGSRNAEGKESEYAILLDDNISHISVPVLLCNEDNVIGNHASSAGKIDEDVLFYIMSRGFEEEEARSFIVQSKFTNSINKIENKALRNTILNFVNYKIKGEKNVK